jgi:hypothetical protein
MIFTGSWANALALAFTQAITVELRDSIDISTTRPAVLTDDVVTYKVEEEYLNYLRSGKYNVRFLGTDYKSQPYTGFNIPIDIVER